jgi:hypothetical protein
MLLGFILQFIYFEIKIENIAFNWFLKNNDKN